jgi:nicotinamide-nucleotide adenylyltransferase
MRGGVQSTEDLIEPSQPQTSVQRVKSENMKETVGVYWGRFNPPHKGHIALVKKLAKRVDRLIVAVGNAETRNTKRNPFSGDERVEMLKSYLREQNIEVKDVIAVKDGDSWAASIDNLFEKCGKFDVLFTDHKKIFKLVGGRAKVVSFQRECNISSTLIRDSIAKGEKWENLTGKSVVSLIREFDGIARIKRTYGFTA